MLKYRLVLPKLAGSSISLSATVVASGGVQGWNAPSRRGGRREEVYFIYLSHRGERTVFTLWLLVNQSVVKYTA